MVGLSKSNGSLDYPNPTRERGKCCPSLTRRVGIQRAAGLIVFQLNKNFIASKFDFVR